MPISWEWIRLSTITSLVTKGTTPRGGNFSYVDAGIGFLRAENICGLNRVSIDNLKYVTSETHNGFLKRSILQENDILITIAGTLGRTGIVLKDFLPLNTNQAISIVRILKDKKINLNYLIFALNAPSINKALLSKSVEMAIPNLSLENISDCIIPFPPVKEQNRISCKIEKLLQILKDEG